MRGESGLTASDVALLSGRNTNNDGFGDNGSWWVIIFLIFAFMGWGRNGNGFGGGNGSGVTDNYVLASDFATIQRQLSDGFGDLTAQSRYIQNGLCDGFYAMNTSLLNGFAGTNNAIMTNGYETRNAINNVSSQLASCCCDLRQQLADCCCTTQRGLDAINYNNVINTNAIQQTLCTNTRDIIENQNANYRALHEELVANKLEAKNDRIAEQQNEINALRLRASQEAQNAYLLSELKPCPSAAYIVPNPNCCYNYNITGVGYGNGCCGNY